MGRVLLTPRPHGLGDAANVRSSAFRGFALLGDAVAITPYES